MREQRYDNSITRSKSKAFALRIIKFVRLLQDDERGRVISKQLLRSGTSIGANVRESYNAQSKADFINKLEIALKESFETEYWLELLIESGYYEDKTILEQCIEVKKLLIASLNTAKRNLKR